MTDQQSNKRRGAIVDTDFDPIVLAEGVLVVATQGNGVAVSTSEGIVLIDAGAGGELTDRMIRQVREWSDAPVRAIVYSHGHIGYNAGVPQWRAHAVERGDAAPLLIGHANVINWLNRYAMTYDYQLLLNSYQFPRSTRESLIAGLSIVAPELTFTDRYDFADPERPIEVFAAPSETDDSIGMWLPKQRILYAGPSLIGGFPNIGTPMRVQRFTQRWIDTLDAMVALDAEILIPEFGEIVHGASNVRQRLTTTADALRWLVAEVTVLINRGMTDVEILHNLPDPGALFDHPHLAPTYGDPSYVVRDLFREQSGWWTSRNPTDLHPAHPDAAAAAVFAAVDPAAVLAAARGQVEAGQYQLAMHVLDLIALTPDDVAQARGAESEVVAARELKAECCDRLARSTSAFVSRSLYFGSARLLRAGKTRWSQAPEGLDALDALDALEATSLTAEGG